MQNRVDIIEISDSAIHATCMGSNGNRYEQSISVLVPGDAPILDFSCSCPVISDCKHCAAVMFYLQSPGEQGESSPHPTTLNRALESWISDFPTPMTDDQAYPANVSDRLLYRLIPEYTQPGHWTLNLYKGRQLKDGSLRDIKSVFAIDEMLLRQPRHLLESDIRIARLLVAARANNYRPAHPLVGSMGADILERAVQTSRAYLDFGEQPLVIGESRQGTFAWIKEQGGAYRGQWLYPDGSVAQVVAVEPLYYLDKQTHEVGRLLHDFDDKTACHITLAPEVPARMAMLLGHRLQLRDTRIPPPEALSARIIDSIEPQARLTLGSYDPKSWREKDRVQHHAGLLFTYAGQVAVKGSAELVAVRDDEIQRIQRQSAIEKALRERLQQLGFKAFRKKSSALPDNAGELFELGDDEHWLAFMETHLPVLRGEGWQVDIHRNFHFDLQAVEQWYADIEESPAHEWFDLELGIVVNGERHSLLPIVLHLMRSRPDLVEPGALASRRDDEHLMIDLNIWRLGKGSLKVALPYARVKMLMAMLGELYLGEHQGRSLRLNAPDAARLSALDRLPMAWNGGERLREFARRLRASTGSHIAAPTGLNATLRPYQLEGLNWMQTLRQLEVGGILGDDMGLGKTLQALAHLLCEKQAGRLDRPALVVMPTSLIPNWLDEALRFTPQLSVLALHGSNRQKDFTRFSEFDVILTTYALLPRDLETLGQHTWSVLILDEAQNIKNPISKAAQAARQLEARQRLCLSGTPLENHLGELWSLFHLLLPGWLGDSKTFNRNYRTPIEKHGDRVRLQHLVARIKPFMLRRTKELVASELPAKTEIIHWVELSDAQRDVYETVRVAMDQKVRDEINRIGIGRSQIVILEALLKLRQVCCDLRLVKSIPSTKAARSGAGKIESLMQMLDELVAEGRRILLFSQFTSMLALIEEELQKRDLAYSILTGETDDRRTPVKQFQGGMTQLFLISLKAGGTGLNLTAADTVIHYDPWWNPAVENQATDRAYRIGQDKPVFVYKLIARGTVEEKIQQLQQKKADLAAGVLEGGMTKGWALESHDIDALFAPLPVLKG
nr:DEAD/DEAH box helicase [Pseudomonas akapageensis]